MIFNFWIFFVQSLNWFAAYVSRLSVCGTIGCRSKEGGVWGKESKAYEEIFLSLELTQSVLGQSVLAIRTLESSALSSIFIMPEYTSSSSFSSSYSSSRGYSSTSSYSSSYSPSGNKWVPSALGGSYSMEVHNLNLLYRMNLMGDSLLDRWQRPISLKGAGIQKSWRSMTHFIFRF